MLFSAEHMLSSILSEFTKLTADIPDINQEASSGQAITACLKMLELRERKGSAFISNQLKDLKNVLAQLSSILNGPNENTISITELLTKIDQHDAAAPLTEQETYWLEITSEFEKLLLLLNKPNTVTLNDRTRITQLITNWEAKDLASQAPADATADNSELPSFDLSYDSLNTYLNHRFQNETIKLVNFKPLPGGYGKETSLFSVEGDSLNGDFVVRRDYKLQPVSNDCHRVKQECEVIKAVYDKGFPAPHIAWVDTEHTEIPGGDFIVMHRSPGAAGGNVFGANTQIADSLVETLAKSAAWIHKLPPLTELGNLTTGIYPKAWETSTDEMVFNYLNEWYELFLNSPHTPSAAIASAYGWLFDNITDVDYKPVLLHGDIGFHNMLIHEGELSALVDWEFAHVGDPAEDLGLTKNSTGDNLDWDKFMAIYSELTGFEISPKRVQFFQIWGHVRNATASNMTAARFADKITKELKLAYTGCFHMPHFINKAHQLINDY